METGIISHKRAHKQFGHFLEPDSERINCGIGMELKASLQGGFAFREPTLTFKENMTITIAGRIKTNVITLRCIYKKKTFPSAR